MPTYTYRYNIKSQRIIGYTDKQEAMRQAIYKIVFTERYQWAIYSWNYGIELADLFGKPTTYCVPEIERRVKEALEWDDRIDFVDSFEFRTEKKSVIYCKFTAHTIFGDVDADFEVAF
jgi:hypothetical protein